MKRSVQRARANSNQENNKHVWTVQTVAQLPVVSTVERNDYLFGLPDDPDAVVRNNALPEKIIPTKYLRKMGDTMYEFDSTNPSIHLSIRGTIDTQAHVNVTPHQHILHNFFY